MLMAMQIVASVIIIGNVRPYLGSAKMYKEFFNETILMFVMYTIMCFSPWVADVDVRFFIGYITISCVCLHLFVNLFDIVGETYRNVRFSLLKRRAKKKYASQRQRLQAALAKNHEQRRELLRERRMKADQMLDISESVDEDEKFGDHIYFGGQTDIQVEEKNQL